MTQFHEGQEVEVERVFDDGDGRFDSLWYKAKIISPLGPPVNDYDEYLVELSDGTREVFEMHNIRTIRTKHRRIPKTQRPVSKRCQIR